jgi:Flp pilus assembly pilin Flp
MFQDLMDFLRDESGATAIEYGLICTVISCGCVAALEAIGTSVITVNQVVSSNIASTTP